MFKLKHSKSPFVSECLTSYIHQCSNVYIHTFPMQTPLHSQCRPPCFHSEPMQTPLHCTKFATPQYPELGAVPECQHWNTPPENPWVPECQHWNTHTLNTIIFVQNSLHLSQIGGDKKIRASLHLRCRHLCILDTGISASFGILLFYLGKTTIFGKIKRYGHLCILDAGTFASWIRASLHLGYGHLCIFWNFEQFWAAS